RPENAVEVIRREAGHSGQGFERQVFIQVLLDMHENPQDSFLVCLLGVSSHLGLLVLDSATNPPGSLDPFCGVARPTISRRLPRAPQPDDLSLSSSPGGAKASSQGCQPLERQCEPLERPLE